ncbi:MAG TPA: hypothetical protein EYG89_02475 [Bacteroidia bacterium]|nr:hypothetical protein [Bacteroidia bacterium]
MGSVNSSFAHFYTDAPGFYFSKNIYVNGGYYYYSDENLKDNISRLKNYRDILKIDAVRFD